MKLLKQIFAATILLSLTLLCFGAAKALAQDKPKEEKPKINIVPGPGVTLSVEGHASDRVSITVHKAQAPGQCSAATLLDLLADVDDAFLPHPPKELEASPGVLVFHSAHIPTPRTEAQRIRDDIELLRLRLAEVERKQEIVRRVRQNLSDCAEKKGAQ